MEERFSVQITWKISLETIKNPGQLKFTDLPHGILFCQERPEILGGLTNQIFSHKANIHPAKFIFEKETKRNLRPINFQYWNEMTTKLARYI